MNETISIMFNLDIQIAVKKLNELMKAYFTLDSYRACHGNSNMFTWKKWNDNKFARLDLILTSETLRPFLIDAGKIPKLRSDHCPVYLSIDFSNFKRGPGTWKFNNLLLKDANYLNFINNYINISYDEGGKICPPKVFLFFYQKSLPLTKP